MLAIRMQRTGRKGHAMFRVVVQDSRRTPTSGKIVATLGSYDPHQKVMILNKERAEFYLKNGAQPSDRSARLLKNEGIKLPNWVTLPADKERSVKNADKRRSTRPPEPVEEKTEAAVAAAPAEAVAEDTATETVQPEAQTEQTVTDETPAEPEQQPEEKAPVSEATEEVVASSKESKTDE
jgi:small subunit ribosomal protein S16